jgi:hypothetical protein
MVPIIEGWEATYENPAIVNSEERRLHFGRVDHLRWYGADLRHRLRSAGFELTEFTAATRYFCAETSDDMRVDARRGSIPSV